MSGASMVVVGGREASLSTLRSLRVVLPTGGAYRTVVGTESRVAAAAHAFLGRCRFATIAM